MFNRSYFNRSYFNRPSGITSSGEANIEIEATATARVTRGAQGEANIEIEATAFPSELRQMKAEIEISASATAKRNRWVSGLAEIEVSTEPLEAQIISYLSLVFTGDFAPGDVLLIDTDKKTAELNGGNALHLFDYDQNDFFELLAGLNELVYSDSEGSRNLNIQVEFTERFI